MGLPDVPPSVDGKRPGGAPMVALSRDVLRILGRDRRSLAAALFVSATGGLIELSGAGALYLFVALLSRPETIRRQPALARLQELLGCSSEREFLAVLGALALAAFLASSLSLHIKNAYLLRFSLRQAARVSRRVLRACLHKPYLFFVERRPGEIAKDVIAQADGVANGLLVSWVSVLAELPVLCALTGLVLYADWTTGLLLVALLGSALAAALGSLRGSIAQAGARADEANGARFHGCLQVLQSAKEIKASRKEEYFCGLFEETARDFAESLARAGALQTLPGALIQAAAASAVLLLALAYLLAGRELPDIVPLLTLYAVAGFRLLPSVRRVAEALTLIRRFRLSSESVLGLLREESGLDPGEVPGPVLHIARSLELRGVRFAYPGAPGRMVLDGVGMEIPKGAFIALVGGSGAGKTTLVDILLGLLPLSEGELLLDGVALGPRDLSRWRRSVGYIPQFLCLLDESVAANIAFGVPPERIDWDRVRKAAALARLEGLLESLAEGLHTRVADRGSRLSGGERQRLGIARALYADPSFLILDESTGALDGATEREIVGALQSLKGEKTVLAIAHRPSTIRGADAVFLLEGGRIAASGSCEALLRDCPRFAQLMAQPAR